MINAITTPNPAVEAKSSFSIPQKVSFDEAPTHQETLEETPQKEMEKEKEEPGFTQETLDTLSKDIEVLHSVSLSFARHESTGRTMVEVFNRDTDELIRQIPAENILDMAAKLDEMVGLLFDEKV